MPTAPGTHYFSPITTQLDASVLESSPQFSCQALGHLLTFSKTRGVFSVGALDSGSKLLLENLQLAPQSRVCDLGCGWGAIGAFVAAHWPRTTVYSVDINARAAGLAAHNYRLNKFSNASAWCGDGVDAVPAAYFSDIVFNPPVRAGNAIIQKLLDGAQRTLSPGGSLWLVLRTSQGAKSWQKKLAAQFGNCETVQIDQGYRILRVRQPGL